MLFWITLAVAILIYGVIAFLSARNWQIGHVILLFAVSMAAFGALILGAMVLKTQQEWRTLHDDVASRIGQLQTEMDKLDRGSAISPTDDFQDIPTLKSELSRVLIDRGRVWRGVTPAQIADGTITLTMQGWGDQLCAQAGIAQQEEVAAEPPADGAPAPQPAAPHGIEKGVILFAFAEVYPDENRIPLLYGDSQLPQRDAKKACRLPSAYLGRFLVAEVNEQSIQLTPVYPMSKSQQDLAQQKLTWALYETMPKDQHDVFAGKTLEQLNVIFRQPPDADPAAWKAHLEQFVRDGQPAEASDPPEQTWVQIRFLQDTSIDVDAAEEAISYERPFDATGRATQLTLRQGKPTDFKKGDVITLSMPAAKALVGQGSAELTDEPPIYRRPLRDLALILQSLQVSIQSATQLAAVMSGDQDSIERAIQEARDQSKARQQQRQRLEEDLVHFQEEKKIMEQVTLKLQTERDNQRREQSRLYQSNRGLRDSLTTQTWGSRTVAQSVPGGVSPGRTARPLAEARLATVAAE